METNGRSARQPWNPAALLQPTRRSVTPRGPPTPASARSTSGQSTPRDQVNGRSDSPLIFQFDNSGQNDASPEQRGGLHTGAGSFIERINNVQYRDAIPDAKRRRLEEQVNGQDIRDVPVRSSSGILGQYVQDKRKDANESPSASVATVDLTNENDDEHTDLNNPRDEEVCYGMIKTSLNCNKVPSQKPGQHSLLGPHYHPGIKVMLKRQANDKTLRVPVIDHTRNVIGFLEQTSASALAPLLDNNLRLRTDSRIPPRPKKPGEEPGQSISQSYTLDIVMYGPFRYQKTIGNHLQRFQLRLLAPSMVQKGIRVCNPHTEEYRPPAPKMYPINGNGSFTTMTTRTVEEIRSEVLNVFDSLTRSEDLPELDANSCITTPLLKHQRQGLYFMQTREKPRHLQAEDKSMKSFWQTKYTAGGEKIHHNVITGQSRRQPPPETRGGILADMMGLGKTLSILSLIANTMDEALQWQPLRPQQRNFSEPSPSRGNVLTTQPNFEMTPLTRNARATLLVCPLSTISNWEEQLKQHVSPGALSYHVYHGPSRIKEPAMLAEFDIVITTYGSVSNELSSRRKGKEGLYPLEEIAWFRIVLDEAHMIREQSTLQFKAICRLEASRRWAVTGTPVQNRLDDLSALLAFLRLDPFHDRTKFARYIVEPFKACDPEVVPKLRILVDTITLRRLKDKINLPPREDVIIKLDFSMEERGIYEMFEVNAKERMTVLTGANNGRALGGNSYIHILKAILRLRLLCAHGKDLLSEEDLASLRGMSAEMAIDIDDDDENSGPTLSQMKAREMFALMRDTNNDACIACNTKLGVSDNVNMDSDNQDDTLGYMTPCFHVICRSCIKNYEDQMRAMLPPDQSIYLCPECQATVKFEFVELRREEVEAEHTDPSKTRTKAGRKNSDRYEGPHTKTRALVEDLLKSKAASEANLQEAPFKSVVFSGWTSHLDLIELALDTAGIRYARLDGTMSRIARTAALDSFREDRDTHVILVSIMAGGLGLNLTAGNSVYVMEPQYNPAAEAQAIDRVHRLGQKRPVRTVRYIMSNSFEEKMLELQEKKRKLASLSMDGQNKALDKTEATKQKLEDLRSLFKK